MAKAQRRFGTEDIEHYDRPRRRTRPRTKDRPSYDDADLGRVITVDRGRFTLVMDDVPEVEVWAVKARPLGRKGVVVGDRVKVVGDTSGSDGALARIVELEPRATVLRRTADDDDPVERVVVANADQLVIVTAIADPEPRTGFIDRALVAAFEAGIDPLLCITKADLADPESLVSTYRSLGVPWVVTQRGGDISALKAAIGGRTSVLLGHSGVGKSTLVNAILPDAHREIGHVNAVTGRGRHTSTSALMLRLPEVSTSSTTGSSTGSTTGSTTGGGWIIDTPGIRTFGLAHVEPEKLIISFPDLKEAITDCPRGCTHSIGEPECGLDVAIEAGRLDPERVISFRRLLEARSAPTYTL